MAYDVLVTVTVVDEQTSEVVEASMSDSAGDASSVEGTIKQLASNVAADAALQVRELDA